MQITRRETQCLEFIEAALIERGRAPFQYEIAAHFGTTSRGFVWRIPKSLEAKGLITMRIKSPRDLAIVTQEMRKAA